MRVALLNLTDSKISCQVLGRKKVDQELALPHAQHVETVLGWSHRLALSSSTPQQPHSASKECLIQPEKISLKLPLITSALWHKLRVPKGCPYLVYMTKAKKAYKLVILRQRNIATFLSDMPDTLPLSSLCLPGTHDTMALYGWPISQCQEKSTPLMAQLQSGIRVIDIRLAIIDGRLIAYHGIYPERTPFQDMLKDLQAFLTDPNTSRETVVMSIKQEDFKKHSYLEFSQLVHDEIFNGPGGRDMWFFENRIPRLGEVRGKVVLFSRFGGNGEGWEGGWEGLGIHPLVWPDSDKNGFTWECKETFIRTHDWYNLPSFLKIPDKFALTKEYLLPPPSGTPSPNLSIVFLSAASFPLALPPAIAKGVGWPKWGLGVEGINSRYTKFLLDQLGGGDLSSTAASQAGSSEKPAATTVEEPRIRGWTLMDFFAVPDSGLVPLLVECNYRGRKQGEEGW